mmetsp:Transcript_21904/g.60805  ORF Transcript_21904/g.60805 Transcript_21904/m.60805 type:complete len:209 (+) Transcript_21904:236-862(+)
MESPLQEPWALERYALQPMQSVLLYSTRRWNGTNVKLMMLATGQTDHATFKVSQYFSCIFLPTSSALFPSKAPRTAMYPAREVGEKKAASSASLLPSCAAPDPIPFTINSIAWNQQWVAGPVHRSPVAATCPQRTGSNHLPVPSGVSSPTAPDWDDSSFWHRASPLPNTTPEVRDLVTRGEVSRPFKYHRQSRDMLPAGVNFSCREVC